MTLSCITTPQPLATLAGLGVVTVLVLPDPAPEGLVGERIGIYADKTEPEVDYDMGDWRVTRVPDVTITIGPGEDVHLPGKWIVGNMLDEAPMRIYSLHPGHIVASATLQAVLPVVENSGPQGDADPGPDPFLLANGWMWDGSTPVDLSDQLPYLSDIRPGMWCYLLSDPAPTTTRCPVCWGSGEHPYRIGWNCMTCNGSGSCEPIRVAGGPGVWGWTP